MNGSTIDTSEFAEYQVSVLTLQSYALRLACLKILGKLLKVFVS